MVFCRVRGFESVHQTSEALKVPNSFGEGLKSRVSLGKGF